MYELKNDSFFGVIAGHPDCCVDYCLMKSDLPYRGEESHREAIGFAMQVLSATDEDGPMWEYETGKARAHEIEASVLLAPPEPPWKTAALWKDGSDVTRYDKRTDGGAIPYWQAFLMPPFGSGDTAEDFCAVNRALFPNGAEDLVVYEWTTDWSDYFDAGHEWWGAACWSAYDRSLDRYAVILASASD